MDPNKGPVKRPRPCWANQVEVVRNGRLVAYGNPKLSHMVEKDAYEAKFSRERKAQKQEMFTNRSKAGSRRDSFKSMRGRFNNSNRGSNSGQDQY
jgi:hypothetical protein